MFLSETSEDRISQRNLVIFDFFEVIEEHNLEDPLLTIRQILRVRKIATESLTLFVEENDFNFDV